MKLHKETLYDVLKTAEREAKEVNDFKALRRKQRKLIKRYSSYGHK